VVIVLSMSRHDPENCPLSNSELRSRGKEVIDAAGGLEKAMEEREATARRQGIHEVGTWVVPSEHLIFRVTEAPSLDAYHAFKRKLQSPLLNVSTTETRIAFRSEEALKTMLSSDCRLSESEKHLLEKIIEWFL